MRLAGFALLAAPEHDLEGDGEQQQSARDAEGGKADAELREQPVADKRRPASTPKAMRLALTAIIRRARRGPCPG